MASEKGYAMDRSELRQFLQQQLEDDTAREFGRLDDGVNLREDLGIDSVDLVTLIVHTQGALKIEVPSAELEKVTTMGNLLDVLQSRLAVAAGQAA
jgi:acyl carrier protein